MIATWMLYSVLCAAGLSVAAILAERVLLSGGGAVRHAWIAAIVCALVIPVAAYQLAPRPVVDAPAVSIAPTLEVQPIDVSAATSVAVSPPSLSRAGSSRLRSAAMAAVSANRSFVIGWIAMSAALALYFVVGVAILAWMRRRWERRTILGVSVLVSERTGPAVVGTLSPAIVMPEWAINMQPSQLALMLRHEEEHRRAGDAQLLTAAHIALILMPWNPAVWWMMMRLGMAVELDCDARVLQGADARSYGDLLLEVARPRRGPRLIGATAFSERAGQLERRIRAITRRRDIVSRRGRIAALLIGLAAIGLACVAPHPAVPPRVSIQSHIRPVQNRMGLQQRVADAAPTPKPKTTSAAAVSSRVPIQRDTLLNVTGKVRADTLIIASPATVPSPHVLQERAVKTEDPLVDSAFARLFSGITLTTEQANQARDLLTKLALTQRENDIATVYAMTKSATMRIALQASRDSALRTIVTSDADRVTLDARLAASGPLGGGRRGRSGSPAVAGDTLFIGGGGRGFEGARGRGRSGGSTLTEVPVNVGDAIYAFLFQGIGLSPDQELFARKLIADTQQAMQALIPQPPLTELRLLTSGAVLMRPDSKLALTSLITSDADRNLLESRIAFEQRVIKSISPVSRP